MKKRVLLITDEMEIGGTQKQICNLLKNIDKKNIDIELVYFVNSSYLVDDLLEHDIKVTHIPKMSSVDIRFIINLLKFVWSGKFDVIHAFAISAEFWGAIAYLLSPTRNLVTSIRGVYEWYTVKHWFIKSVITCLSYRVVGNSNAGIGYAKKMMWCKRDNYQLIYNGISPNSQNYNIDFEFDESKYYILSVGRLIEGKNNSLLIKAVSRLNVDYPNLELLLIGDGPDRNNLEGLIKKLRLNNVKLLGEKTNVPLYMENCHLLVHPSLREGLSNTILEAFMNNLLVLASDADGNIELIKNNNSGLLFKNDNLNDLVEKIKLIKNSNNEENIKNAHNAIKQVFSISTMCREYQELYENTQ